MDQGVRIIILMFVVISLIYILSHQTTHQPKPVAVAVIPYCEISLRIANKNIFGQWRYRWVTDFGPCSLSDRYEEI